MPNYKVTRFAPNYLWEKLNITVLNFILPQTWLLFLGLIKGSSENLELTNAFALRTLFNLSKSLLMRNCSKSTEPKHWNIGALNTEAIVLTHKLASTVWH